MQQKWVIGNWKMNGTLEQAKSLFQGLKNSVPQSDKLHCAVCPPAVFLPMAAEYLQESSVAIGGQNICAESADYGAYTGEISASMLQEFAVSYVLLGHSERREYYAETDAVVVEKFKQAKQKGLTPVLCVGESLQRREAGEAKAHIAAQVEAVVSALGVSAVSGALIAYEPIWAIGTGLTATPEQAQEIHQHIRSVLAQYDEEIAAKTPILYGGSVNAANAESLFAMRDINGALVGGASLKLEEFTEICTLVG